MDIMLSRGIDPNVLDPTRCHSHPDVPATWPSKQELLDYVAQVRPGPFHWPACMHAQCMLARGHPASIPAIMSRLRRPLACLNVKVRRTGAGDKLCHPYMSYSCV
jgi:hypothetical protein